MSPGIAWYAMFNLENPLDLWILDGFFLLLCGFVLEETHIEKASTMGWALRFTKNLTATAKCFSGTRKQSQRVTKPSKFIFSIAFSFAVYLIDTVSILSDDFWVKVWFQPTSNQHALQSQLMVYKTRGFGATSFPSFGGGIEAFWQGDFVDEIEHE